jgi:hypothetical protein
MHAFHPPGPSLSFCDHSEAFHLLHLHQVLTKRKYRLLFSPKRGRRSGPKGPTKELIETVVEMKRRNPIWGCPESLNRSLWLSASKSIRTWFAGSWPIITDRNSMPEVPRG